MMRTLILLSLLFFSKSIFADTVTFHFYGAYDCPPCMKFKNQHLQNVEKQGQQSGFSVKANVIERTSDVPVIGSYGENDPLLRRAGAHLRFTYPPVFFVTQNDTVVGAWLGNWRAAQKVAIRLSADTAS